MACQTKESCINKNSLFLSSFRAFLFLFSSSACSCKTLFHMKQAVVTLAPLFFLKLWPFPAFVHNIAPCGNGPLYSVHITTAFEDTPLSLNPQYFSVAFHHQLSLSFNSWCVCVCFKKDSCYLRVISNSQTCQ